MPLSDRELCPVTNKTCYSQKEASETITKIKHSRNHNRKQKIPKRSYLCQFCGKWHLTHFNNFRTCKTTLKRYGKERCN